MPDPNPNPDPNPTSTLSIPQRIPAGEVRRLTHTLTLPLTRQLEGMKSQGGARDLKANLVAARAQAAAQASAEAAAEAAAEAEAWRQQAEQAQLAAL